MASVLAPGVLRGQSRGGGSGRGGATRHPRGRSQCRDRQACETKVHCFGPFSLRQTATGIAYYSSTVGTIVICAVPADARVRQSKAGARGRASSRRAMRRAIAGQNVPAKARAAPRAMKQRPACLGLSRLGGGLSKAGVGASTRRSRLRVRPRAIERAFEQMLRGRLETKGQYHQYQLTSWITKYLSRVTWARCASGDVQAPPCGYLPPTCDRPESALSLRRHRSLAVE